jgi:hypothetical protein
MLGSEKFISWIKDRFLRKKWIEPIQFGQQRGYARKNKVAKG